MKSQMMIKGVLEVDEILPLSMQAMSTINRKKLGTQLQHYWFRMQ